MWFPFALSFALTTSISIIIAKKVMSGMNEYLFLWLSGIFTIPFLLTIVIIFYQIPKVDQTFWINTAAATILNVFAAIFAYRAIKMSEVSLVSPISAFNPVFTAIISFITLNEIIGLKAGVGIVLICIGAYLLQISKSSKGVLQPLKALLANKGVQLSMVAYFLWAITPTFQKVSILHTNPQVPPFASLAGMIGATLIYSVPALNTSKDIIKLTKKYLKLLFLIAVLGALGQAAAFVAFSLTNLGFATAVFKLSMIFSVILGWLFFKEHNIKERLLGSTVMLVGVLLLL